VVFAKFASIILQNDLPTSKSLHTRIAKDSRQDGIKCSLCIAHGKQNSFTSEEGAKTLKIYALALDKHATMDDPKDVFERKRKRVTVSMSKRKSKTHHHKCLKFDFLFLLFVRSQLIFALILHCTKYMSGDVKI
jgi:hypothetical protein